MRLLLFGRLLFLRAAGVLLLRLLLLLLLVLLGLWLRLLLLLGRRLGGLLEQLLQVIAEPAPVGGLHLELFPEVDPCEGVVHRTGRHRLLGALQPLSPRDGFPRQRGVIAGGELRLRGETFDKVAQRRGVGRGVLGGETGNRKPETGEQNEDGSSNRGGSLSGLRYPLSGISGQRQAAGARPHGEFAPEAEQQAEQRGRQRPLESLQLPHLDALLELAAAAGLDRLLEQRAEVDPCAGVGVNAIGGRGEFLQRGAVEPRKHDGAALVLHVTARLVGDERPLGGADPQADHADVFLAQVVDEVPPGVGLALAVAQDDEVAVGRAAGAEGVDHRAQHRLVIRAAHRHERRIERGQKLVEHLVVRAHGHLEEGRAGEHHQADALAAQSVEEALDQQPRALEPRGPHVGREHAARKVEGDDDLARLVEHRLLHAAPLRPGEGHDAEREAEPEQQPSARGVVAVADRRVPGSRPGPQDLRPVAGRLPGAATERIQHRQDGHGGEEPEELGPVKDHGSEGPVMNGEWADAGRRHRVVQARMSAASNRPARPGPANHGKSSVVMR